MCITFTHTCEVFPNGLTYSFEGNTVFLAQTAGIEEPLVDVFVML